MITFKQFISEEAKFRDLLQVLEDDCAPFLNHRDDGMLYRGVRSLSKTPAETMTFPDMEEVLVTKKITRTDRWPKDTTRARHQLLDDWFVDNFRIAARSSTVFCVGESGKRSINDYGTPCLIFPIGNFRFVWSPKVIDLFSDLDSGPFDWHDEDEFHAWMEKQNYTDKNFSAAIHGYNEIMVECDSYYAIPIEHEKDIRDLLDGKYNDGFDK